MISLNFFPRRAKKIKKVEIPPRTVPVTPMRAMIAKLRLSVMGWSAGAPKQTEHAEAIPGIRQKIEAKTNASLEIFFINNLRHETFSEI